MEVRGIFLFATVSRPALGPIQPPRHWVPGTLFSGGQADPRLHLVPRLRTHGAIFTLLHTSSWCGV